MCGDVPIYSINIAAIFFVASFLFRSRVKTLSCTFGWFDNTHFLYTRECVCAMMEVLLRVKIVCSRVEREKEPSICKKETTESTENLWFDGVCVCNCVYICMCWTHHPKQQQQTKNFFSFSCRREKSEKYGQINFDICLSGFKTQSKPWLCVYLMKHTLTSSATL